MCLPAHMLTLFKEAVIHYTVRLAVAALTTNKVCLKFVDVGDCYMSSVSIALCDRI